MRFFLVCLLCACAHANLDGISQQPTGWLDRVVLYHKTKLFGEFDQLPAVDIKVSIKKPPPGYVDSESWDFESVIRLLNLIRLSESARDVHRSLQRVLAPSRRGFYNFQNSFQYFPPIEKPQEFYLDYSGPPSEEEPNVPPPTPPPLIDNEDVIEVSNPVESRLPSAHISVSLIKRILLARAFVGRIMPTPETTTVPETNSTDDANSTDAGEETTAADDGGGEDEGTTGGEDEAETTAAAEPAPEEEGRFRRRHKTRSHSKMYSRLYSDYKAKKPKTFLKRRVKYSY